MELRQAQYERIAPHLPVQWGNVSLSNHQILNTILYVAGHGRKWRGLPSRFGNWHTIYTRLHADALLVENGVLDRVFEHLQREQIVRIKLEAMSMEHHHEGTSRRHRGAKKRPPIHRPVPRPVDHHDSL